MLPPVAVGVVRGHGRDRRRRPAAGTRAGASALVPTGRVPPRERPHGDGDHDREPDEERDQRPRLATTTARARRDGGTIIVCASSASSPARHARISATIVAIDGNRSSGSFARARSTICATRTGTSGRSSSTAGRILVHVPHRDGHEVLAGERNVPGQELEEDDAEGVDVRPLVDRAPARLLGRDVVRGADHGSRQRHPVLDVERAGDPEVGDLRPAVAVEEHVLRLHVPVHDPVLVRAREPLADLDREVERTPHRQRPLPGDELLQVLAVDVLEHDVLPAAVLAAVDHRDDVRVRELRHRPRLAAEALDRLRVCAVVLVQELQRHVPLEQRVAGPVDGRHSARPRELLQLVPTRNRLPDHRLQSARHPGSPIEKRAGRERVPPGPRSRDATCATSRRAPGRPSCRRPGCSP